PCSIPIAQQLCLDLRFASRVVRTHQQCQRLAAPPDQPSSDRCSTVRRNQPAPTSHQLQSEHTQRSARFPRCRERKIAQWFRQKSYSASSRQHVLCRLIQSREFSSLKGQNNLSARVGKRLTAVDHSHIS